MPWPLDQRSLLLGLLAFATALGVVQSVRLWLRESKGRRSAARARRVGRAGERDARRLLERARYRIDAEQPTARIAYLVDGEPREAPLRPDFLVSRRGLRYVADAKKGADAVRIERRATRRQLLEYALAFPEMDGVLLVDAEAGRIHEIVFPGLVPSARPRQRRWPVVAFLMGSFSGALALGWAAGLLD